MKISLLWDYGIENDKDKTIYDLKKEIEIAFKYFYKKMGYYPDTCYINSATKEEVESILEFEEHKLSIGKQQYVLPKHLMIGREADEEIKIAEIKEQI